MHGRPLPEHADLRKGRPAAATQWPSSLARWFHGVALTSQEAPSRLRPLISAAGYLIKPIPRSTASQEAVHRRGFLLTCVTRTAVPCCGQPPTPGLEIQPPVPLRPILLSLIFVTDVPTLISFLSPSCCYTPFSWFVPRSSCSSRFCLDLLCDGSVFALLTRPPNSHASDRGLHVT